MSFKRRMVRRQTSADAAPEAVAGQLATVSPEPAAPSSFAWEVAAPRTSPFAPVPAGRGRVVVRRTQGKASGHR